MVALRALSRSRTAPAARRGPPGAPEGGYTLFLVVELITLSGILFSIALHEMYLVKLMAAREMHRVQARLLAESGITRAEYFLSGGEGRGITWESEGFDEPVAPFGAIHLECKRFGLFAKIVSRGTRVRTTHAIAAIAGRATPDTCKPVLTLSGKVGGLALMPSSRIRGTVALSHGKIHRGETSQEVRDSGLTLEIRDSPSLPFDSSLVISVFERLARDYEAALALKTAVTGTVALSSRSDSLARRKVLSVNGDCRIERGSYEGLEIAASGTISIGAGAKCTACALYARHLALDGGIADKCVFFSTGTMRIEGGSYNSQAFCTDSLLVSDKVTFGKMSLCALLREGAADSTAAVRLAPGARIRATIICCSDSLARAYARVPSVVFGKGCSLSGACLTDGDIDIHGATVKGHLWARSIVTSDGAKGYVNYCFGLHLEEPTGGGAVFPLIGEPPAALSIETLYEKHSVEKRVPKKEPAPQPVSGPRRAKAGDGA